MQANTPNEVTFTLTGQQFCKLVTWIVSYQEWIKDIVEDQGESDLTPLERDLRDDLSHWIQLLSKAELRQALQEESN